MVMTGTRMPPTLGRTPIEEGQMSTTAIPAQAAREELGASVAAVIGPDDAAYDETRALFNAMIDKRPALIVQPVDAKGVAAVIAFAREHDLPLAIRCGGHNGAGSGSVDDGIVCDLAQLKAISVDPATRTVRVGGGALWGEVDAATSPHGLAVPAGIISTTGVSGLTLGGGHGYLTRAHGLTIDNLVSAGVVLADGRQVTASADENPDLFWALRGGGGNFGVVTEFTFRAVPVSTVVGGPTFWALEQTDEMLAAYREWLPSAPRNVSGFFNFHTVPPAPPFPEEIHNRLVCGIVWSIDASDADAEKAMKPMLDVAEPLMHGAHRLELKDLNGAFDGLYGPGDQWYWRGDFVREIPDAAIAANREWNSRMPGFKCGSHLYPIDGAAHDVAPEDTAFAFRDATWSQVFIGVDPDPASAAKLREWTVGYHETLHPFSAGGAYVNFMMDEGQARVKATYGPNYARLAKAKAAYDPDNVFRVNQNIAPGA
jgi:FAD/FMN-containing dehydrogenase